MTAVEGVVSGGEDGAAGVASAEAVLLIRSRQVM